MKKDIASLFNRFAGKEVQPPDAKNSDTVIREMQKIASDNGFVLRVWFPGMGGTKDYRVGRINAYVEKGADGKYRVGNRFSIG